MKTLALILFLALTANAQLNRQIRTVLTLDGTVNSNRVQQAMDNIYNNFQAKQFNRYVTIPSRNEIGESNLVLAEVSNEGFIYTIIDNTTYFIQLVKFGETLYLTESSATATYVNYGIFYTSMTEIEGNYLTNSSATATYVNYGIFYASMTTIDGQLATIVLGSSISATYVNYGIFYTSMTELENNYPSFSVFYGSMTEIERNYLENSSATITYVNYGVFYASMTEIETIFVPYNGADSHVYLGNYALNTSSAVNYSYGIIKPAIAIPALRVDQQNNHNALHINSEATTVSAIDMFSKYGLVITQDISNGRGLYVQRNINEVGNEPLVTFLEDHTAGTQDVVIIRNDGRGNSLDVTQNGNQNAVKFLSNGSTSDVLFIHSDGGGTSQRGMVVQVGTDDNSGTNTHVSFKDGNGGAVGSITSSGGTTAYNTTSDKRLKKDIMNTKYGLIDLMKLGVKDFKFIENDVEKTGLMAQDVNKIYPIAVTVPNNPEDDWGIDYGKFTPLLIKAVQELTARIEELEKTP